MIMIDSYKHQPIIIGLAGKAGSGKTSVAEHIVPKGSVEVVKNGIKWDHIFYALPLYEMASIKKNIKGFNELDRKKYAIHEVLYDLYGGSTLGNMPSYEEMYQMVQNIYSMQIEEEGTKPRTFLQKAGDICREHHKDCFAQWAIIKSHKIYRNYLKNITEEENANPMAVLISDVRYLNEAQHILKQPNGFVICFDASKDTLDDRLYKRDGKLMSQEHSSHRSENEIEQVKGISSLVINTDNMTVEEQAEETLKALKIKEHSNA